MRAQFRKFRSQSSRSGYFVAGISIVCLAIATFVGLPKAQSNTPTLEIITFNARMDPSKIILLTGTINGITGGGNMTLTFGGVLTGYTATMPASATFYKTYSVPSAPSTGTVTAYVTWNGMTSDTVYTTY